MCMLRYTKMERRFELGRYKNCICYTEKAVCHTGLRSALGVPQQHSKVTGGFLLSPVTSIFGGLHR
jgi:hypothetical protein